MLAAALALSLAGCGKGTKSEAPRPATSSQAVTTAPTPTEAAPKRVTHRVVVATKKRLVASRLRSDDIGLGWVAVRTTASPLGPQQFCNRELSFQPFARADVVFHRPKVGGIIAQSMSAYPGRQAQRVMGEFRDIVDRCNGWSRTDNGRTATYTLKALDFPAVGDESSAARLNTSFEFNKQLVTLTSDFVMLREGNVVQFLSRTAPVGQQPPTGELAALAQRAAARLTAGG